MIVAIIQARMGATRLPGKVLKQVDGISLLQYQIARVKKSKKLDKIVVATTILEKDDSIVDLCHNNNITVFRGSENDVLDRYYQCAKEYNADVIVRLTADCPFIDPAIIDQTIELFLEKECDFAANTVPVETSKFPDGSDVEVFSMDSLERAHKECKDLHYREHVTFYFWKDDNGFKTYQLDYHSNYSKYRFTVDYPEDFEVVTDIDRILKEQKRFGYIDELVEIIDANPNIKNKNSQYYFGIGWGK